MVGIARKDDTTMGTCYNPVHDPPLVTGGSITTASEDVTANGKGVARLGDTVTADCGHTGKIISASGTITTAGKELNVARLNDSVGDGDYIATITSASTTVTTATPEE